MMKRLTLLLLLAFMLTGCGLTQRVSDSTTSVAKAIFYKQVKTLHLDLIARAALNPDEDGMPLATDVWMYQLKDRQAFEKADYATLQSDADTVLGADLVAEKDVWIRPGTTVSLDMPLDEETQYVALVAQFRSPDARKNDWRLVLMRDDLDPDKPRTVLLKGHSMTLKSTEDK
ncbi:type VI secretion system lipoprotein TssJ [Cronobacter sakazakii]|nr:type VI secretion system lipoprotein TssJ [Cronobacter sakazakii]ELY2760164.1 type VI secretion system lipoprotein TssJ [Cronobacter sakazakii]ELY3998351.1 type VI secretion system lipoprotein TssJ [Cronobacter sakazakii]ELY4067573.1 type VI secretion system lipoprotein TssJ [Cronobacter sakazakii]ELY4594284.1 type VI secretion system lipoprotein TssJ [Cronobacter sakazakii]